jgi:hypothetical protein
MLLRSLHLHHAFDEGRRVRTGGVVGRTRRRRIADLVLPTGELTMGYPGDGVVNRPSDVHPRVPPGRYPVFFSDNPAGYHLFAFLTVLFADARSVRWERAGQFFTDSGTGCVFDRALTDRIRGCDADEWRRVKEGIYEGGDGSLVLDAASGANAIVFRTLDWAYDCFVGRDARGGTTCLVVDGRWHRWWDAFRVW